MKKDHYSTDSLLKNPPGHNGEITITQAIELADAFKGGAVAIQKGDRSEVLYNRRFDMEFGKAHVTPAELGNLPQAKFHRLIVKEYIQAFLALLNSGEEKHTPLKKATLGITYPTDFFLFEWNGFTQKAVVQQNCHPFLLDREDGNPSTLAWFDTFEKTCPHVGSYFHVAPLIKINGREKPQETMDLISDAGINISTHFQFTETQWRILELLSNDRTAKEICEKLNKNSLGDYEKAIRIITKPLFPYRVSAADFGHILKANSVI